MKSKRPSAAPLGCNAVLPPNKVAELVRQLAEAQYEAEQLRQRMERVKQENASFRAVASHRYDGEREATIAQQQQQQQQRHDGEELNGAGSVAANTTSTTTSAFPIDTTAKNWSHAAEKPDSLERRLPPSSSPPPPPPPPPPQQQQEFSAALSSSMPCRETTTNELSAVSVEAAAAHVSLSESYWKNKYTKLKRLHEKALMERDMQLAEVQHMVLQIHEEHDEMRHRHERDRLQQQLEQETRNRQQLESHTKALQEEALAWRQRYLRFLEAPALTRLRVLAPDMPATLNDAGEAPHHLEGLNQTDQSCILLEAGLTSTMDTEVPPPHCVNVSSGNRAIGRLTEGNLCVLEQQLQQQHKQQQQQQRQQRQFHTEKEEGTLVEGRERNVASASRFTAAMLLPRRSIGVQAVPATVTGSSQTEMRCPKSVAAQIDIKGDNADELLQRTPEDGVMCRVRNDIHVVRNRATVTPLGAHMRDARAEGGSHTISRRALWSNHGGRCHSMDVARANKDGCVTSPHPAFSRLVDRNSPPNASPRVLLTPFAAAEEVALPASTEARPALITDQAKRERLEEDIRRHDQLLEAVSKLQRRVQRVAKTPSFN